MSAANVYNLVSNTVALVWVISLLSVIIFFVFLRVRSSKDLYQTNLGCLFRLTKKLKVVYHEKYRRVYSSDPASAPERIESIFKELQDHFKFVEPEPASEKNLKLVHGDSHINSIKGHRMLYEVAVLAVGGAIKASELAMQGEPAFGLIRPPGHHASQNSCWGFCFFNNVAISIERLRQARKIERALIVDVDLHYGDGTANIFEGTHQVAYFHVEGRDRETYFNDLARCLSTERDYNIIAVSAGFDRHLQDWGGLLKTEDYRTVGKMVKEFSEEVCQGKRYGVLEGGYNHAVLGKNVKSFLEGMA